MPSITIAAVPIQGHVTPLLAAARHFAGRGDRVRFITGSRFADAVGSTGAEHLPLPAEADFDDRQDWNKTFPERAALKGTKAIAHDIVHVFVRPGEAQHDAVMATLAAEPADVLLTDPALTGSAFLLGHPLGVRPPIVMCGICPLMIPSRDTAPFGMGLTPMRGPLGRLRNTALALLTDKVVFPPVEQIADQIFHRIHARPIPFAVLDWPRQADAIAQFTVPEFEYPRSDAPASLHFTGPISASGSRAPLPPWWQELDGSRPVVHVTQGTIANRDFGQLVKPTLEALADEDVLVAVATGGRPVASLPPLPANARAAEFLPYDDLLPKTDVYVTNGGYGGVQYALRYGVPIVAAGSHEDKPEVVARVAWTGVGRRIRTNPPTPNAVRRAVRAVLGDPRYRHAAHRMAERMTTTRGVHRLAEIVDTLVADYRRTGLARQ
ncbi:glycosyltransferase [Amycolatopsis acidiphila]|uniref:Glycosyltransferase family 1 protein n=1 Tax=Amycolatopsis acidiphila TaxID=715473 RepID=A0A558AMV1_9PSEU|nr:glycosyltransferase [Amycolatopsis acidiphila]TVT25593.1 glycosyltransferase family 1 protein [Amycolatopsis acidiphila]UIJ60346.1 glycosyltransferase [Amycolatopsis acidiphila]